jgi:hypothetical protein
MYATLQGEDEVSASLDFLQKLYPNGPWTLTSIALDRKSIEMKCFGPREADAGVVDAWIASYEGKRNLYFGINTPYDSGTKKRKLGKEDIGFVCYLHVDIDYRAGEDQEAEKARILGLLREPPANVPPPTGIWLSGGGAWAIWKLAEPIPVRVAGESAEQAITRAESAEQYNRFLELQLTGDNCFNVDRIARLVGTTNLPDARKLAKGRVACMAELVCFDESRVYPLEVFGRVGPMGTDQQGEIVPGAAKKRGAGKAGGQGKKTRPGADLEAEDEGDHRESTDADIPADGEVARLGSIADLDVYTGIPDRVKVAIVQGRDPDHPKDGDDSRSAWLFDVVCSLMRAEVPDELIYSIITDPRFLIAESVIALGRNMRKYAMKQLRSAHHATWDFARDDKGRVMTGQYNISKALTRLGIHVGWNEHAGRHEVEGLPGFGPALCDAALTRMRLLLEKRYKFLPQKEYFYEVVTDIGRYNSFHPVKDYLRGLHWDGTPRIDTWLVDHAGAPDSPYVRAVSGLWLMAAVKRVFYPGCKFDEMLVLESPQQGMDKSSGLAALCPEDSWFSDDLPLDADGKRVIEQTRGRWIVECAELKGMKTRDVEHMKSLLARRSDTARMAYGKIPEQVPRQCVFAGTTNESHYLVDPTGNRRFWPVLVERFKVRELRDARDQLWAEAYKRVDEGASIRLDPALYEAAGGEQADRVQEDPWGATIERLFHGITDAKITYEDVWVLLGVEMAQRRSGEGARIRSEMMKLGWKKWKSRLKGVPTWVWQIGDGTTLLKASEMGNPRDDDGAPTPDPF